MNFQVIPLRLRDVLMCLHENGSVSIRNRRRQPASSAPLSANSQGISTPSLPFIHPKLT